MVAPFPPAGMQHCANIPQLGLGGQVGPIPLQDHFSGNCICEGQTWMSAWPHVNEIHHEDANEHMNIYANDPWDKVSVKKPEQPILLILS